MFRVFISYPSRPVTFNITNLQLYELLMMGVNTRNMYSCLQICNKLNKSHLVGQFLNSIHDARTHVYKTLQFVVFWSGILNFVDNYQVSEENATSIFAADEPIETLALYQTTRHKIPTSLIFNPVLVETKCFSRIYILKED